MNDNTTKIHIIKSIRNANEIDIEPKAGVIGSSFVAGYFGLANLSHIIEYGKFTDSKGLIGATIVTGSILIAWLSVYIKEKINALSAVKAIREKTGMTQEEQRQVLEKLVLEGDAEAVELFDYFYGEKKRKRLS